MRVFASLSRAFVALFGAPIPVVPDGYRANAEPCAETKCSAEARRKSIHDVTLEQLGIAHWSLHTLF